ncbi:hypothetical protein BC834DRAFT_502141 [Gloeopeniophorella convolvens]|nr:hypothetical protein BC834DRAFT_502141 [Gloeopeniophorella convolvens]
MGLRATDATQIQGTPCLAIVHCQSLATVSGARQRDCVLANVDALRDLGRKAACTLVRKLNPVAGTNCSSSATRTNLCCRPGENSAEEAIMNLTG